MSKTARLEARITARPAGAAEESGGARRAHLNRIRHRRRARGGGTARRTSARHSTVARGSTRFHRRHPRSAGADCGFAARVPAAQRHDQHTPVKGGAFVIEPLAAHDRSAFSCGSSPLDRYLREQVGSRREAPRRRVASCCLEQGRAGSPGTIRSRRTRVPAHDLPPEIVKRLPRHPVLPAALVGHLAVDRRFPHRGLASALVADAANRVLNSDTKTVRAHRRGEG